MNIDDEEDVVQQTVPAAVFGAAGIDTGGSSSMGALERFKRAGA